MFHQILVPLDETAKADDALAAARFFAERDGAHLLLLSVVPHASNVAGHIAVSADLSSRVQMLRASGIDAEMLFETGDPTDVMAHIARTRQVDLIVAAPHRRHGLDGLRHPSVTRRIFSAAPIPVYVCPEQTRSPHRQSLLGASTSLVIVPLDASEGTEQAIAPAAAFAREYGRTLLLLRVVGPSGSIDTGIEASWWEMQELANAKQTGLTYLRESRHLVKRTYGMGAQTMLRVGDPAAEIAAVAQAHPGSLIVMGTHVRSGLARPTLGSVTYDVVTHAHTPVLVVPIGHASMSAPASVSAQKTAHVEVPFAYMSARRGAW